MPERLADLLWALPIQSLEYWDELLEETIETK
jgi:coproporphyrinogen III oxidase-like Fe-S oxidoreductase